MENQKSKKLWKPPSFEDFNVESQPKRIKLDHVESDNVRDEAEVAIADEPKTVNDLATHPKKVEEIRNWFENGSRPRASVLLITGPAGSAKTVTLKTVASSLGISLREWINPVDKAEFGKSLPGAFDKADFAESGQNERFEDFVFRASRYKSLFEETSKAAILVEDFPNVFVWKPKLFHEFLEKYQRHGRAPLVFICTDDRNLNLHNDLFPNSVKTKFGISEIKFNPVNHSSLMRTLKKALASSSEKNLSQEVLQSIALNSNGDLRNALSNLRIILASSKPSKPKKSSRRKESKSQSKAPEVEPVSVKDTRAEFFQALGRVLYPKTIERDGKGGISVDNENRILLHDVIELSDMFTDSFLMLLHENYLSTFSDMKSVAEAANILSFCDNYLKQDNGREFASLIAIIGLMIHNKKPKREGFKPMKKCSAPANPEKDNWMKGFECSGFNATNRILSTDIIPYLKVLSEYGRGKSDSGPGTACWGFDPGDNVDIEEFED